MTSSWVCSSEQCWSCDEDMLVVITPVDISSWTPFSFDYSDTARGSTAFLTSCTITCSPSWEVGGVTVVVVVRTNLLHQLVVSAVEGDEDADDFEGLGAQPGHMALGLLLGAALRGVVGTQWVPGALLHLFILHSAVEQLGFLGLQSRLLLLVMVVEVLVLLDLKLHGLCGRNEPHGNIALTRWVVPEVDTESAIPMIHNFTGDEKVQLHRFNVGMEITPTKHLLELPSLDDGPPFCPGSRVVGGWGVVKPVPLLLFGVWVCLVVAQIHRREVLLGVEALGQQATNGDRFAAFSPVGLHFGFWALSEVRTFWMHWVSTGSLEIQTAWLLIKFKK